VYPPQFFTSQRVLSRRSSFFNWRYLFLLTLLNCLENRKIQDKNEFKALNFTTENYLLEETKMLVLIYIKQREMTEMHPGVKLEHTILTEEDLTLEFTKDYVWDQKMEKKESGLHDELVKDEDENEKKGRHIASSFTKTRNHSENF
jgi:hypothetical protein